MRPDPAAHFGPSACLVQHGLLKDTALSRQAASYPLPDQIADSRKRPRDAPPGHLPHGRREGRDCTGSTPLSKAGTVSAWTRARCQLFMEGQTHLHPCGLCSHHGHLSTQTFTPQSAKASTPRKRH